MKRVSILGFSMKDVELLSCIKVSLVDDGEEG